MNREWSENEKQMTALLKKNTFAEGIGLLLQLRDTLMREMDAWQVLSREDFCAIPFLNAKGYHSKTAAYSLWHIFRIEDIVVHSLIRKDDEILFSGDYENRIHSPIITTGNELQGMEIAEFSRCLDISALYEYTHEVKVSTDRWLKTITYSDLKTCFSDEDRERLRGLRVVSPDENACWLIDYWCGKDVRGLIGMPLSRHWIMHTEAALRILHKLGKYEKPTEENENHA